MRPLLQLSLVTVWLAVAPGHLAAFSLVERLPSQIREGDQSTFSITLSNASDDIATISSIKPSCGCVVYLPDNQGFKAVPPNGVVHVKLHLNTQEKIGPLKHALLVTWNGRNGASRTDRIALESQIMPNIVINADAMDSDSLVEKENSVKTVPFSLTESEGQVTASAANGVASVIKLDYDTKAKEYKAFLRLPSDRLGEFTDTLVIQDQKFTYRYPVAWTVHSPNFDKYALTLGLVKRGESRKTNLQVTYNEQFDVTDITASIARGVEWKVISDGANQKNLEITLNKIDMPEGQMEGAASIVIKGQTDKQTTALKIPIYALLY